MNTYIAKDGPYLRGLTLDVAGHRLIIPRGLGQLQGHAISPLSTLKINVKSCHYVHAMNSHSDLAGGCVSEQLLYMCRNRTRTKRKGHILTQKETKT